MPVPDESAALRFKIVAVRAVLDSPRAGTRDDLRHLVAVEDIERALDGHLPEGGPCVVCEREGIKTTWRDRDGQTWWLCVECMTNRDGEIAAMRRVWDLIPEAEQDLWRNPDIDHSTVAAFLPHPGHPGPLRRKFDSGRGAMVNENDVIVGYYTPPKPSEMRPEELVERVDRLVASGMSTYDALRAALAQMIEEDTGE